MQNCKRFWRTAYYVSNTDFADWELVVKIEDCFASLAMTCFLTSLDSCVRRNDKSSRICINKNAPITGRWS